MPPAFANHANTALNVIMTNWISVSNSTDRWIAYDVGTDKFHFNADIAQDIRDHLSGVNGKFAAEFISFPDGEEQNYYFVKGKNRGVWNAVLPDYFIQKLSNLQRTIPNFDLGLKGILFGKGKTNICMFETGFAADFDEEEVPSNDHPLCKAFLEFSGEGWCLQRGSLCLYDSRFFFLKFQKPGENLVRMSWNLPINMATKLDELKQLAEQPEERMAWMQEEQMWMNVVQTRIRNRQNGINMLVNVTTRGSLNVLAAAYPGSVVERYY
ncbi:hypothetical protein C8R44DRAFT_865519 [Mycena epipterygia]|nr:hypothetical protein C8R44DRAFT_865519 [Mycena epipterygia]